jgi:hypothetical protein
MATGTLRTAEATAEQRQQLRNIVASSAMENQILTEPEIDATERVLLGELTPAEAIAALRRTA